MKPPALLFKSQVQRPGFNGDFLTKYFVMIVPIIHFWGLKQLLDCNLVECSPNFHFYAVDLPNMWVSKESHVLSELLLRDYN